MPYTSTITVDFTGTSHGGSDTFTVDGQTAGNTPATGVSKTDLENGYTYTHDVEETTGFTVTAENGVCSGELVGTYTISTTPTPTPTPTPAADTPTPTPTPVPGTSTPTPTATPTPTPEPPQIQFYIQDQDYSSEGQACAGDLPGTAVYVTASVGSFTNFVNNLVSFTTAEKTIYLDNGLTPGNEFGGIGNFHLADSDGVGAGTHALRVSSGVVDLAYPCVTPTPTPTPIPEVFYELRASSSIGTDPTGWSNFTDACNESGSSFNSILIESASLPVTVGDVFYAGTYGPGNELQGNNEWFKHPPLNEVYRIDNLGTVQQIEVC